MENDGELAWTLEMCCNKSCNEGSRQLPHIGQLKRVIFCHQTILLINVHVFLHFVVLFTNYVHCNRSVLTYLEAPCVDN